MLRFLRTHWLALRSLRQAQHSLGFDDSTMASTILNIDHTDPNELGSRQISHIYRDRTVRDAVVMQFIQVGSFWLHQSLHSTSPDMKALANSYYKVLLEAAIHLSIAEHTKESNHRNIISNLIREHYQEERGFRQLT